MSTWNLFRKYFSDQQGLLIWYVSLAVIHGFMLLPVPLLLRFVIDHVASAQWNLIGGALGILLFISVTDIILSTVSRFGIVRVIKNDIRVLQEKAVETIVRSPHRYSWIDYEGDLQDIIVHDTYRLDVAVTVGLGQVLPAAISTVVLLGVLFFLSPVLFLVSCGIFPACVFVLLYSRKRIQQLLEKFRQGTVAFEKRVGFLLKAWDLVKVQTAEQVEIEAHHNIIQDISTVGEKLARQQILLQASQEGMGLVFGVLLLGVGFFFSSLGWLSISQVISFFVGFSLVRMQLAVIFTGWPHVITLASALLRIEQVMTISSDTPYIGKEHHVLRGRISLDTISISVAEKQILENVSATFQPGILSVIEGGNGAGKTTLLLTLLGLLVPDTGEVLIDGKSLKTIDVIEYRRQVAIVSQEALFLDANAGENERYGLEHEPVSSLLYGDDFFVDSERNALSLSGGEKQRLMISRALQRNPKILLLDEITNHLDSTYREKLFHQLREVLPFTAIICVTHDQQLIAMADERYRLVNKHLIRVQTS